MDKAKQILELVTPFVKAGKILPRTYAQINGNLDDFVLLFDDDKLIACAGLKDCQARNMGEIYSLAVAKGAQKSGFSTQLLVKVMNKAKTLNFSKVFALSKHNKHWFIKQGFVQMEIADLPTKRQVLFNYQRNSSIFFKGVE